MIKDIDPPRFKDLEYTMRLIFNHDDDAGHHNHSQKLLQASHVGPDTPAAATKTGGNSQATRE